MRTPMPTLTVAVRSLALSLIVGAGCGGTDYVQPPIPVHETTGPVLALRALSFSLAQGVVSVEATGVMRFGETVIGTFAEDGTFTLPDGQVWARMDGEGTIAVVFDDPATQAGPTEQRYPTARGRLVHPEGALLATLDASGQLVTPTDSHSVVGISSRTSRLALFLYLVAATYAEDMPVP